jgi:predicted nucleotidyltransferase
MEQIDITFKPKKSYRDDIKKAISILREERCSEVYVFGSIATDKATETSDIDIGIRGYPRERFFRIYGRLISELDHEVDLVDFDQQSELFTVLQRIGEIRRIA